MTTDTIKQQCPAGLWEAFQEVLWKQDVKFIQNVSRIISVPVNDIKKRILGTRGVTTIIPVENGPWWLGTQCPVMEFTGGNMWRRCSSKCEQGDTCWSHRMLTVYRRYDDPYFTTLPKRHPIRYDGAIYWVSYKDGSVINGFGAVIEEFKVDLDNRLIVRLDGLDNYSTDKKTVSKTTKGEETEATEATEATEEQS